MSSFIAPPSPPPEAVPIPNRRTDAQPDFDTKTDAYLNWLETFRGWMGAARDWLACFPAWADGVMASANQAATDAQAAAIAAGQAALAAQTSFAGKTWVPGADYAVNDIAFGVTTPGIPYRCYLAIAGSDVPPENDLAHWVAIGVSTLSIPANPPHVYVDKTSPYAQPITALEKFNNYEINTEPGSFTVWLPMYPQPGDWVGLWDEMLSFRRAPLILKAYPNDFLEGVQNNELLGQPCEGIELDLPYRGYIIFRQGSRGWTIN